METNHGRARDSVPDRPTGPQRCTEALGVSAGPRRPCPAAARRGRLRGGFRPAGQAPELAEGMAFLLRTVVAPASVHRATVAADALHDERRDLLELLEAARGERVRRFAFDGFEGEPEKVPGTAHRVPKADASEPSVAPADAHEHRLGGVGDVIARVTVLAHGLLEDLPRPVRDGDLLLAGLGHVRAERRAPS